MNRNFKLGLTVFILFIAITGIALAIPQTFNINGKLTDTSNTPLSGTYTFNFSIYSAATGGSYLWNSGAMSVTTDSNGIYNVKVSEDYFDHPKVLTTLREGLSDVILSSVNLEFADQYYLGIKVGTDAEMSPRLNLTSSPYAFVAQNVSAAGIIFDANVDAGSRNITTTGSGFFGWLGSLTNIAGMEEM